MSNRINLQRVVDVTKEWVAKSVPTLSPRGDILPHMVTLDGKDSMHTTSVHPAYLDSPETKENLAIHLREICRKTKAIAACFVFTGYFQLKPVDAPEERNAEGGLVGLPGVVESVCVLHVLGSVIGLEHAAIIRAPEAPPCLGPWESLGDDIRPRTSIFGDAILPIIATNYAAYVN